MKKDIIETTDVELLIQTFYKKLLKDELLAPHFEGIDLEHHFPRMYHFWNFFLLGKEGFTGNVFDKHKMLNIGGEDFDRWLAHFDATVDELFEGEVADKAKNQAALLGFTFNQKMSHLQLGKYKPKD
jgi:hemoglobin